MTLTLDLVCISFRSDSSLPRAHRGEILPSFHKPFKTCLSQHLNRFGLWAMGQAEKWNDILSGHSMKASDSGAGAVHS